MVVGPVDRALAKYLCEQALNGDLRYGELETVWPAATSTSPLLSQVRDDIAEGVAHFPATPFSHIPVWTEWYSSWEYKMLALDESLLANRNASDESLLRAHETLSREIDQSLLAGDALRAVTRDMVARYFTAAREGLD